MHAKGEIIEITMSDGKVNRKLMAKVVEIHYSKKNNKPIHYTLEDINGNRIIKSIQ